MLMGESVLFVDSVALETKLHWIIIFGKLYESSFV